jgi:hypothetical protein
MAPAERRAHGKRLRDTARRDAHAAWRAPDDRVDPIGVLRAADAARQPDLEPLRYGRMLQSPFTFYRGSASVMAADLALTPASGIRVQVCGDCYLMNFGGFATPGSNDEANCTPPRHRQPLERSSAVPVGGVGQRD